MSSRFGVVLFMVLCAAPWAAASDVPPELAAWESWALYGHEERTCPPAWNDPAATRCVWPAELDLDLSGTGGGFSQVVRAYQPSWILLPGGPDSWPQDVRVNEASAPVSRHNGVPALFLGTGIHRIRGAFSWERPPESLPVPPEAGLVRLALDGKGVPFPDLRDGRLWLKTTPQAAAEDRMELRVFRLVTDDVPLVVTTLLEMDVAGRQRELTAGPVLPDGPFLPLSMDSPLPARLEADGMLRVQARPGHWAIKVRARSTTSMESLEVPRPKGPWPGDEIWAFEARPNLRLVEPSGLASVDPNQTGLPKEWRGYPAFVAMPGETLGLKVVRRGDPVPAPDNLSIERILWLDFDGGGYTARDVLNGTLSESRRLEAAEGLALGRVSVDGEPRLITRRPDSPLRGVEMRRGRVAAEADSRIEGPVSSLPATGWAHDFTSVAAELRLPPGWEVFAVQGVDAPPDTWIQRWSLLDLFLVLVLAVGILRLWGRTAGALGLVALALAWHQPFAPRYVWLHVLAASALVRYLPKGRAFAVARAYRLVAAAFLALFFVPFAVDQVRTALYPQLERVSFMGFHLGAMAKMPSPSAIESFEPGVAADEEAAPESVPKAVDRLRSHRADLTANVQTGPGLPGWNWRRLDLVWSGPVGRDAVMRILYVPPAVNAAVRVLRVLLVGLLGLVLVGARLPTLSRNAAAAAIAALLTLSPAPVQAEGFPPKELLDGLRTRLLEPPKCLPDCAQVSRLNLEADRDRLRLRLEVHALDDVSVPLPGDAAQWVPETAYVDGRPAEAAARDGEGVIWLALGKGLHQVVLEGPLPRRAAVSLSLRLPVGRAHARVSGWTVEGIHDNGVADPQVQLTRRTPREGIGPVVEAGVLPAFVVVERTLDLGLEWKCRTRVRRSSPPAAVVLEVPLLDGESVITEGIRVEKDKAFVSMAAGQDEFTWESALPQKGRLSLRAPEVASWVEVWRAQVSPIWHMEQTTGVAVVHDPDPEGEWSPEWRPWPGESVEFIVTRPEGVPGPTLTLDDSRLSVRPGRRAADAVLSVSARSSLGGQHTVRLPHGAELTSVQVDGDLMPIRQEEGRLTLPVRPGRQTWEIAWRQPGGVGSVYRSPAVDLGMPHVNHNIEVDMPPDRWVVGAWGPRLGPAVLFWSLLAVVTLASVGLGRLRITPLRWWHWLLLGIGLTQASVPGALAIVAWLAALGLRRKLPDGTAPTRFNLVQVGVVLLTALAAISLAHAVQKGLLGLPSMQVTGNGSFGNHLQWYADRVDPVPVQGTVLSAPLMAYRLLMLGWALWLAWALVGWIRWGWESFTRGGNWRQMPLLWVPSLGGKKKEGVKKE